MSPRMAKVDRELVSCRRDREDDEMERLGRDCIENNFEASKDGQDREYEDGLNSDLGSHVGSDFTDEDDDVVDTLSADDAHVRASAWGQLDGPLLFSHFGPDGSDLVADEAAWR
ncbi:hypothetical protein GH714_040191 [Hevea brasiliensis]|uniref:Uncharacterized protein n=1 Tax=Hevea brasiliensis TaxID=3981 RepID=A0A6A6MRP5_HEVBR|nr:hypothetical protein GH714_040191 [Hevea brasiliensis]